MEWFTSGHPLFEAVRCHTAGLTTEVFTIGSVYYSLAHEQPAQMDIFRARVVDGLANSICERLFAVEIGTHRAEGAEKSNDSNDAIVMPGEVGEETTMKPKTLSSRHAAITLAGSLALTVLFAGAGTATAGDTPASVGVRPALPSKHHRVIGRRPFVRRHFVSPIVVASETFDTPAPQPSAPTVIIQEAPPVYVQQEPPPPPVQPSYYWYYCGPAGRLPSPGEHATAYCLGGISPSVMVLPGLGKTLEQFQADDTLCQHWASARAGTAPGAASPQGTTSSMAGGSVQERFDTAYQQCMYAKENQIPAPASTGPPGNRLPSTLSTR